MSDTASASHASLRRSDILRRNFRLRFLLIFAALVIPATASAERHISEESILFRRLRGGVFTVFGDEGQGSGFLVDTLGIILTNDHVVGTSARIRVKLDDSTRVEARLLASDPQRDVAAIWINPDIARGRPVLTLATQSDTMVIEGEKVLALGSPLHQEAVMTTGIVSKLQPTAIISDVNLNHGNSGGPLVNMDGDVVGINTFGDMSTQGGPGISGSINIAEATEVLRIARLVAASGTVPSGRRLPLPSSVPYPLDSLQAIVQLEKFDADPYAVSNIVGTGKFEVAVNTPIYMAWKEHRFEVAMAKKVHHREQQGNTAMSAAYYPLRGMRDWMRYTGHDYVPVVTLQITPKSGETGASIFGNVLGSALLGSAYRPTRFIAYRSDFKDVSVTRDSVEIEDVGRGRVMVPLAFAYATWSSDYVGQDMARVGFWQCTPECFRPVAGHAPHIRVSITSVEHPDRPTHFDLPEETVRRIWDDFVGYRRLTGASVDSLEYRVPAVTPMRAWH